MQKVMTFLSLPFYLVHAILDLISVLFFILASFVSHGRSGASQACYVIDRLNQTLEEIDKEQDEHENL